VSATIYVWVLSGKRPPVGFIYSGVASYWPHTGAVRAELWERSPAQAQRRPWPHVEGG
jgi:hypothetical protein